CLDRRAVSMRSVPAVGWKTGNNVSVLNIFPFRTFALRLDMLDVGRIAVDRPPRVGTKPALFFKQFRLQGFVCLCAQQVPIGVIEFLIRISPRGELLRRVSFCDSSHSDLNNTNRSNSARAS